MRLSEATFVIVDTETTGVDARADRVVEIGAVKVKGGEVVGRFQQLVNPGRTIPRRITAITGISTPMVLDAPPMEEVLPGFLDFLGDGVFVGHNVAFDLGFLNAEAERLGRKPIPNPTLCTIRLARRILKGLRSKGLTSVADHYGIKITGRHRALGDADATAQVLLRFLAHLGFTSGIDTVEGLLAYQNAKYLDEKTRHLAAIREKLAALPDRPGVYFMHDTKGSVVYVGKAKSLKHRVRSYFTGIEGHSPRLRQLVETVRDVSWQETGSELGALLLESRLIKEQQPRFNRAQRRYRNRPFIRLSVAERFPRVSSIPFLMDDGAEYFGPLGGRRQAEVVVEVINRFFKLRECDDPTLSRKQRCLYHTMGRCLAPCAESVNGSYHAEVDRVRDFLLGRDTSVLVEIEAAMREAAARHEYELAGTMRDWLRALESMAGKQRGVAASVLEHNAVVVQPGEVPGTKQLFVIRYGRHAETLAVPESPADEDVARIHGLLARYFGAEMPRPARYLKREVDEIRVLAHWLYVYRNSARQVRWGAGMDVETLAERVLAAMAAPEADEEGEAEETVASLLEEE